MKILIIDDSEVIRFAYQEILKSLSLKDLEFAEGGEEGLQKFKHAIDAKQPYEIVIIDYYMPDLYGQEVIQLCRDYEKSHSQSGQRTRMILTTTNDDKDVIKQATAAGADEFLFKPVSLDKFKNVFKV